MKSRHFPRVNYSVGASIKYGNNVVMCNTDNLSLQGIYLKTDHEIPLNTPVNVTVYQSSQESLKISARVVRKQENGVGVQIDNLSASSFELLSTIVAENSNNHGNII